MHPKLRKFSFLIAALLIAASLSWALPAPDKTEGRSPAVPATSLDFRLPAYDGLADAPRWDAAPQAGPSLGTPFGRPAAGGPAQGSESEAAVSRLSLRLYGGYSYLSAGDVNEGAKMYFGLLELYTAIVPGATTGGYHPVHGGLDFGGDIVYQITPSIGVGAGAGYLRSSSDSAMEFSFEELAFGATGSTTLSAVPIRLGLFFDFPIAERLSLTADAGAVYYAGLKLDSTNRIEIEGDFMDFTTTASRSGFSDFGARGDLGLEYRLSPRMGVFLEVAGRYARFKTFDQATQTLSNSGGSDSVSGKLYIATETFDEGSVSAFVVSETPPVDSEDTTYREPKIDLSGFSLQLGFRFRF